jgi:hypothetical protein
MSVLSESSRSYMLAFLYVFVLLATVHIFHSRVLNRTRNAVNSFHNFQACRTIGKIKPYIITNLEIDNLQFNYNARAIYI